jgi:hypothetical protein
MMANYTGHPGPVTVQAVLDQIPDSVKQSLTGAQLGRVMSTVNAAYHNGKAACGAEVMDGAIWIDAVGKLIELDDIRAITNKEVSNG